VALTGASSQVMDRIGRSAIEAHGEGAGPHRRALDQGVGLEQRPPHMAQGRTLQQAGGPIAGIGLHHFAVGGDHPGEIGGRLFELRGDHRGGVEAQMGGRIVDVLDRPAPRDPHAPLHVLPAPAGEPFVEGLGGEHVAADQEVGGEEMLFRRQPALGRRAAVGMPRHGVVQGLVATGADLGQGEAAERHRGIGLGHQVEPGRQEMRIVGQHVAVQEQQALGAGVGDQAIAAPAAALVARQADQPGGKGQGADQGFDPGGQGVVVGTVVQQHQLHAGDGFRLPGQGLEQGRGIVPLEGGQDREPRPGGGGPEQVVGEGLAHASLRARSSSRPRLRRPPASMAAMARP
jgi:hypothetical protein